MAIGASINGGAQNVFHTIIKELVTEHQNVVVILPDGPLVDVLSLLKIKLYVINFNSIRDIFRIYKIIKNERCDIINTHLTKSNIMLSMVNQIIRKPICSTLHNDIIHAGLNSVQRFIYPFIYKLLVVLNDGLIVVSEYSKRDLIKVTHVNDSKIRVIRNGIDVDSFRNITPAQKPTNKYIFACVGRLTIEKGHYYLIDAIASLKDYDFECWIIGDGILRERLKKQILNNSDSGKIKFLGHRNDINSLLQVVDAVILPSINENLPISVLEAFALKKPVIASNVGGISELIDHNVSGILIPSKSSKELAKAISKLYSNQEIGTLMGLEGYKTIVNNFSSKSMSSKTLSFYKTIMQR